MNKLKEILQGYIKLFFKTKEPYQKQRIDICKQCPNNKLWFCKICKCFLPAKTASKLSKCPLDKWQALESTNDLLKSLEERNSFLYLQKHEINT